MNTTPKLLLTLAVSSTLLLGCRTPQEHGRWEYKTITVYSDASSKVDPELNRLAQEGWSVVGFSRNLDGGNFSSSFVLKRKK